MQIQYLKIDRFKGLENFEITFQNNGTGDSLAVLVGQNGAGKSCVLEVILRIFGGFFSKKIAEEYKFDFTIRYTLASKNIKIARIGKSCDIQIQQEEEQEKTLTGVQHSLRQNHNHVIHQIMPKRIVSFYSGTHDNLYPLVNLLNRTHASNLRIATNDYLETTLENQFVEEDDDKNIFLEFDRFFIHCMEDFIPIYLVTLLCNDSTTDFEYFTKELGVTGNFVLDLECDLMKVPCIWGSNDQDNFDHFQILVDYLLDYDIGKENSMELLEHGNIVKINGKKLYLSLTNDFFKGLSPVTVFRFLERITLLMSAKTKVHVDGIDTLYLSEGQRQFIKMYGMLSICKNEECLVLMDEPDAHMNPKWRYNLKDYMKTAVSGAINTQVIIVTHDPLVISGMDGEHIKIFQRSEGVTRVIESGADTYGMGIDGLLQSEYYGLKTSYDKETSDKYERRHILYLKLVKKEISQEEKEELRELTKEIGSLPVANNTIDFLYDDFMAAFRNSEFFSKEYLEYDQLEERRKKIQEIIATLYEEIP